MSTETHFKITGILENLSENASASEGYISREDYEALTGAISKQIRTTRFATISSGTSGSVLLPGASTVVLDDFGGTVDAVISAMSGGRPTYEAVYDGSSTIVSATFDSSGNYTLSASPTSYPVAILYRVQQALKDFDDTSSDIVGGPEIVVVSGGSGSSSWGSITGTLSSQTDLQSALNAKQNSLGYTPLNKAGDTMTGKLAPSVVNLVDVATIAVDASLGNQFTVTLGGNRTLGNPTGASNGQMLVFIVRQDGTGGRTLGFDTKFRFGDEIGTPSISTGSNKTSLIGVRYHSSDDKFDVVAFVSNY